MPLCCAQAHEVRPAYLEITQLDRDDYRIVWKQPTLGEIAIRLSPHLSNGWLERQPDDQYAAAGFLIRTWRIHAQSTDTLADDTITIEGLEYTLTDVLLRVHLLNGQSVNTVLKPDSPQFRLSAREERTVPMFLLHGIEHILSGVDHLLFVLGLLLLVRDRWMLLKAVTAFTAAHSITLTATVLAKVTLPTELIEALIALSILFLGAEILRAQQGGTSLTIRRPWAVAFGFGLIHGMGFASGLTSLGFSGSDLITTVVLFNAGVEIGQFLFIAAVFLLWRGLAALRLDGPYITLKAPAYAVGIAGAYWSIQSGANLLGVL
jgi:hydrogenase/urease accessory protein HupE